MIESDEEEEEEDDGARARRPMGRGAPGDLPPSDSESESSEEEVMP